MPPAAPKRQAPRTPPLSTPPGFAVMTLQRTFHWMLVLFACWCLASCGGVSDTVTDASVRIHVMAAPLGRLEPLATAPGAAPAWKLVLRNPYPQAIWYTDRPRRDTGVTPLADYVGSTWHRVYGDIPPNATVHFQIDGSQELERAFVSLSQPAYDDETDTLSFRVELLASSPLSLSTGPMSLRQVSMNVLNNVERGRTVASYVQYADQAELEPTSAPGQYRLWLRQANAETWLVSNAPAQYHEIRSTAGFIANWNLKFGASAPNAAILGRTANGEMRLEFLTLYDPAYDPVSGQVGYRVTSVDGFSTPLEPLTQVILSIDTAAVPRFPSPGKGSAYQAFGHGYDPSTANTTAIYFGSDIARKQMGSLWGKTSNLRQQDCEPHCRDDLQTMKAMGINLVRLYDWDPRNDHSQFLDYAHSLNIKVIVPISNWLATNPQYWADQMPSYFTSRNFGNSTGRDWHPAIAGVTISNELDLAGAEAYGNAIGLAVRFLQEARNKGFSTSVLVGVPVSFQAQNGKLPAWEAFDRLASAPGLAGYRDQLMLNANTYNDRNYLFVNASGGRGWVQQTWARYQLPILFTEIGQSRVSSASADDIVRGQLQGVLDHQRAYPGQVLGAIHFQFDNKVWKQSPDGAPETDTEGAFGAFRHGAVVLTLQTAAQDFDFYAGTASYGSFTIDQLVPTSTYQAVVDVYRRP